MKVHATYRAKGDTSAPSETVTLDVVEYNESTYEQMKANAPAGSQLLYVRVDR